MADARISTSLPSHPKTKKLMRRLGGAAGGWYLVRLFLWVAENRSDGNLSGMTDEDIELAVDFDGEDGVLVSSLVEVGFVDGEESSRVIHDWETHNPWAAGSTRRKEVARANAAKKWGIGESEDGLTNAQKRSKRLAEARAKATHTSEEWEVIQEICKHSCVECGCSDKHLTKDHILAISKGGSDGIENIQPLCFSCNSSKGANSEDKRPADWREMLAKRLQTSNETPAPSPSPSPSPSPLLITEPKGSGGQAAKVTDPQEIIFGYGVPYLVNAGTPDKQARSFLGKLRKMHGDAEVIDKLRACMREKPLQPLEWLAAALPPHHAGGKKPNKQEALEASNRAVGDEWAAEMMSRMNGGFENARQ